VIIAAAQMAGFILASLGLTYLIAVVLIIARPPAWRMGLWTSQVVGFGATCFVMESIRLQKPLVEALMMTLAGAGVGALAAWRWDVIAEGVRRFARERRARRRRPPPLR